MHLDVQLCQMQRDLEIAKLKKKFKVIKKYKKQSSGSCLTLFEVKNWYIALWAATNRKLDLQASKYNISKKTFQDR